MITPATKPIKEKPVPVTPKPAKKKRYRPSVKEKVIARMAFPTFWDSLSASERERFKSLKGELT
jgi:hypothetical protein